MKAVPWKMIRSWSCNWCGDCCKPYLVPLTTYEWLRMVQRYGYSSIRPGVDGFYLKKNEDGRCIFQYTNGNRWLCVIQDYKPIACKLWPFKIFRRPKYGSSEQASFVFHGQSFYIYIDSLCPGLTWGKPSERIVKRVIPEMIQIKLGWRYKQSFSTTRLHSNVFFSSKKER